MVSRDGLATVTLCKEREPRTVQPRRRDGAQKRILSAAVRHRTTAQRLCGDQPASQPTTHLEGGSVSAWSRVGCERVDADHRISCGATKKKKGKGKGALCRCRQPSATPPVRQGHGPPGHGASGSRAVRSLASHRRPEWDNRGEGLGSKVLEAIDVRSW